MRGSCALLLLVFHCTQFASADVLLVPNEYSTLSSACHVATSGDTVAIQPGIYTAAYVYINQGVTVLGMGYGGAQVVVRATPYTPFVVDEGDEGVLIKNLTIYGNEFNFEGLIINNNPNLVVSECRLEIDMDGPGVLLTANANVTITNSYLTLFGYDPMMLDTYDTVQVIIEHCMIDWPTLSSNYYYLNGSTIIYKNNTFLHPYYAGCSQCDYSLYLINNLFPVAWCSTDPTENPDVLEWRYNDSVHQPLEPCGSQIGNFSADPLYCDESAGDYRLGFESPCLGTGENGENVGAMGSCIPVSGVADQENESTMALTVSAPHPNPTTGKLTISAQLAAASFMKCEILDITGRVVWTEVPTIRHDNVIFSWNGKSDDGFSTPAGIYYVRVVSDSDRITKAFCILR
jgi:FlgD Ig-like domain